MNNTANNLFIKLFCFLGPIGNLIPILPFVKAFRFYYIILTIGIVYFFINYKKNIPAIKTIIYSYPLLLIIISSSLIAYLNVNNSDVAAENPFIRAILLITLFIFTIFIGNKIKYCSENDKLKCIYIYLSGYFISLIFGYIFFIGFYANVFSISFIDNFQVLTQMGYGLLRFSPGSYPNEYGIVSSYVLSIITLNLIKKDSIKLHSIYTNRKILSLLFLFTLVALFLTTTRAAYIAYILVLFYLAIIQGSFIKKIKRTCIILGMFTIIGIIVQTYIFDIWSIFETAYESFGDEDASAYERFFTWQTIYKNFLDNYILGLGFGTVSNIHNTYLELIFELGLFGSLIIGIYSIALIYKAICLLKYNQGTYLYDICVIGLIHILWFAMSNHNLNHHLTWFVVFTIYMLNNKTLRKA